MKRRHAPGFTLIELLVVIAIIGLLGTFAIVQLTGAREKARIAKSQAQEGQILRTVGDDLVLRWDFDECSGTSASDSSGYGRTATFNGSPAFSTDSASGNACSLSFNGTDAFLSLADTPDLNFGANQDFTISFWIKTSTVSDVSRAFIGKLFGGSGPGYGLRGNGSANQIEFWSTPDTSFTCTTCNYSDNKWHYVVAIRDDTTKKLYFDGSLVLSGTTVSNNITNAQPLYFGTRSGAVMYTGILDNLRIYRRSLTGEEIRWMYAEGASKHLADK
ncbi:MAG: LamG-like jellyroll fold domain-containing protein [Patescibacteria group bacterium]